MGTITNMDQPEKPKKEVKMPGRASKTQGTKSARPGVGTAGAVSGSGMDRKVTTKKNPIKKWGPVVAVVMAVGYFGFNAYTAPGGRSLNVNEDRIVVSSVVSGTFEDFIPIRGRVTPAKTVFLDAIEGGRVERILVEDGTFMKAGDLIVELSNASLQLSVLGNEARVAEQLNNMRSIELRLEQNKLQHKRNLVDINYQIQMLSRKLAREEGLVSTGAVAKSTFEDTRDTLNWYKNRLEVTLESQATDSRMQEAQLKFLKETGRRLEGNLEISRQNLDNMNVRAPVDGKLSGFNVEIGQNIPRGERLGQIDNPNDFKLTANIDEYYLGRVDMGQTASFNRGGRDYDLTIAKIYPQVTNGQFEVDLKFTAEQPQDIRRGQTLQTKLTLGDATKAKLIPNGAFFQDTGGNWIFVVTADGSQAVKRNVRLGRRNSRYIEVLEGLEVGERVVTSPYTSYRDMERLNLGK